MSSKDIGGFCATIKIESSLLGFGAHQGVVSKSLDLEFDGKMVRFNWPSPKSGLKSERVFGYIEAIDEAGDDLREPDNESLVESDLPAIKYIGEILMFQGAGSEALVTQINLKLPFSILAAISQMDKIELQTCHDIVGNKCEKPENPNVVALIKRVYFREIKMGT